MADEPWWIALAAGIPAALIAYATRRRDSSDKDKDREANERDRVRNSMDERQMRWMDRLERENTQLRERLQHVEQDRDNGWDLARAWHGKAHEMRHAAANARSSAEALCMRLDLEPPVWRVPLDLPDLDEIAPAKP